MITRKIVKLEDTYKDLIVIYDLNNDINAKIIIDDERVDIIGAPKDAALMLLYYMFDFYQRNKCLISVSESWHFSFAIRPKFEIYYYGKHSKKMDELLQHFNRIKQLKAFW